MCWTLYFSNFVWGTSESNISRVFFLSPLMLHCLQLRFLASATPGHVVMMLRCLVLLVVATEKCEKRETYMNIYKCEGVTDMCRSVTCVIWFSSLDRLCLNVMPGASR